MNKLRIGSELAMNKFLFKLLKQTELLNLFNRGSNRFKYAESGLRSDGVRVGGGGGWGWGVGVLDGIKAILSPKLGIGLGLGLSLAIWSFGMHFVG